MRIWAVFSPSMTFAGSLGMVLVLWVGGPMVIAGRITLGELIGFIFYLTLFYEPIGRLHGLNQMLQSAGPQASASSTSSTPRKSGQKTRKPSDSMGR